MTQLPQALTRFLMAILVMALFLPDILLVALVLGIGGATQRAARSRRGST
jgi:hypothetical protein